jgi:hypothetical protein
MGILRNGGLVEISYRAIDGAYFIGFHTRWTAGGESNVRHPVC